MAVKLFEYQEEVLNRLRSGSILRGGVGSGKSLTSIEFYKRNYFDRNLFVITTAKKRDSGEWKKECDRSDILSSAVCIDSWNNIGKYCNVCGAFFIFDEQRLVGSGAWVKAFYQIAKKNQWILLTGTPGDTWMDYIPVFVANGFYKNRTQFIREHVIYDFYCTSYPKIKGYMGVEKLSKLRDQVVVDMDYISPTAHENIYIDCEYDKEKFIKIMNGRWNIFTNEPIKDAGEMFRVMRRLVYADEDRARKVIKYAYDCNKLIIFYNYDFELEILRKTLSDFNIPFAEWNGHKHMDIPKTGRWVYLVQYMAGAEGWNCIETDSMLFYSLNPSYKMMTQAAGRIDRVNTPFKKLNYIYLSSSSYLDVRVKLALSRKEDFNERREAKLLGF